MHEVDLEQNDINETRDYYGELFEYIFYLQTAIIMFIFVFIWKTSYDELFLTNIPFDPLDGYVSDIYFDPTYWYPPLITCGISAFLGLLWQWITASIPSGAIRAVFWFSPTFTSLLGLLILREDFSSPASIVAGLVLILFGIVLFLYGLWVTPRFGKATRILSLSLQFSPPGKIALLLLLIFISSIFHTWIYVIVMGRDILTNIIGDLIFVLVVLVSQFWTMQVVRNVMLVTVSRVMYMNYTSALQMNAYREFRDNTIMNCRASICFGSIVVPAIEFIEGLFSTLVLLLSHSMSSFYSLLASRMMRVGFIQRRLRLIHIAIRRGNIWGFVQVGVHNKGIVRASMDTWDMLNRNEIQSDLIGPFCFFSGVAGGAICSLVTVAWVEVYDQSFDLDVSFCSFLIGYYLVRIAMALPHACVLAYYVASAAEAQRHLL